MILTGSIVWNRDFFSIGSQQRNFVPNVILANSHPPAWCPLIRQLSTWDGFWTAAHAASWDDVTHSAPSACMSSHGSVTVIHMGERVLPFFLPWESCQFCSLGLPVTDGCGIIGIRTRDLLCAFLSHNSGAPWSIFLRVFIAYKWIKRRTRLAVSLPKNV